MVEQTRTDAKELIRRRGRRRKITEVGYVYKVGHSWFVRYYTGAIVDGKKGKKREQKCHRLGDSTLTKDQARQERDKYLAGKVTPRGIIQSTISIREYVESQILDWWKRNLKPSTLCGYLKNWKMYIEPLIGDKPIGEFTTVHAGNFLDALALKGLGTATISHARAAVTRIFAHAAIKGVITGNPFSNAIQLEKGRKPKETHKSTMREVHDILVALQGNLKAQTAVGLCFFAGLRPGETRATKWENYDGNTLRIDQSAWHGHITEPKTEQSVDKIFVLQPLHELLEGLREQEGNPSSGWILRGQNGGPLNLEHCADLVVKPALKNAGLQWHGWYSLRRGLATFLTEQVRDPQGAAGALRHKDIRTTIKSYIGIPEETTKRAMTAFEQAYASTQKQLKS